MTVVVAVACDDGTIFMGGDSFCGDEEILNLCRAPKIYKVGPVGVGLCGLVRSEQVLSRTLKEHIPEKKEITYEWLKNDLADYVHEAMKEHGAIHEKEGWHEMKESAYLLTFDGVIYFFDADFGLWDSRRPIAAIGTGCQFAYGAMEAMMVDYPGEKPSVEHAKKMVEVALNVATTWSPWVQGPYEYLRISPPKSERSDGPGLAESDPEGP